MTKCGDIWIEGNNQLGIITAVWLCPPDASNTRWMRYFFEWERELPDGFTTLYLRVLDVCDFCGNPVDNSQKFVENNFTGKLLTIHDDMSTRNPHGNPLKELKFYIKKQENA